MQNMSITSHHSYASLKSRDKVDITGYISSVETNQNVESKVKNVESKTLKCGVQNSIWSVDSQENH